MKNSKLMGYKTTESTSKEWLRIIISIVASIGFLLIFSAYTSPLFDQYMNYDSGIFMLGGKAIVSGKALYIDFFDHKGPVLFWIEALGVVLGGRIGLFLIQTILLVFDLYVCRKLTRILLGKQSPIKEGLLLIVQASFLILLAYPMANGNLCEEYSIPMILLALYFFIKDRMDGNPKSWHSFYYGIAIGTIAFIRINNAVPIFSIVLVWIIVLIIRKQWSVLVKQLGVGVVGMLIPAAIICIYFQLNHALYEMLEATFLFNFKYGVNGNILENLEDPSVLPHLLILFSPVVMTVVSICVRRKKLSEGMWWNLIIIVLLTSLSLLLGHGYNHYFMIIVPLELIGVIILFVGEKRVKWDCIPWGAVVVGYLFLAIRIAYINVDDYYLKQNVQKEQSEIVALLSMIPEEERNRVLGFDTPAKYYLYADLLPCYKYGILQTNWSVNNPAIMDEYISKIESGDVLWIMKDTNANNEIVDAVLEHNYDFVGNNEYIDLYKWKE